jgi:hypothetical protein
MCTHTGMQQMNLSLSINILYDHVYAYVSHLHPPFHHKNHRLAQDFVHQGLGDAPIPVLQVPI